MGKVRRSRHLAEGIVLKDRDQLITSFDEVEPGDVIIFYYWSLKHAAVVVGKESSEAKGNNRGHLTVIHYALDNLFAKRTIKEDTILFDLNHDSVYRRGYQGFVTYPNTEVINRAKMRLHEQRFSVNGNTSWDFVHWAKVVQLPAVATNSSSEGSVEDASPLDQCVLLPEVGKQYNRFQRHQVNTWDDLKRGVIVEYRYYWHWHQGIISQIDESRQEIKVIHYGTNTLFSKRTIMEDTLSIDLRRKKLWMYRCDPDVCNPPEVIVSRATRRLGEQRWGERNRSWDFCIACVLKPHEAFTRLPVQSWADIELGMILEYCYYGIWHQGIVSDVNRRAEKVKVIHYGTDTLVSRRTIMEDTLRFNPSQVELWKYVFDPDLCNASGVVVEKAKERLNEQKWKKGNRSWDFCKDCVIRK